MAQAPIQAGTAAHPITIQPTGSRVVVRAGGTVVADTRNALTLREGSMPPVQYIPRADADMALLHPTDHATHCPFKGDASYFSADAGGTQLTNAVWSYEKPFAAVAAIAGYLAFYPNKFQIEVEAA
jgi:uncharacterized protein (DUF427 family)